MTASNPLRHPPAYTRLAGFAASTLALADPAVLPVAPPLPAFVGAAIQALKRQLDAKEASNADLRAQVSALDARLAALEQSSTTATASLASAHP